MFIPRDEEKYVIEMFSTRNARKRKPTDLNAQNTKGVAVPI